MQTASYRFAEKSAFRLVPHKVNLDNLLLMQNRDKGRKPICFVYTFLTIYTKWVYSEILIYFASKKKGVQTLLYEIGNRDRLHCARLGRSVIS